MKKLFYSSVLFLLLMSLSAKSDTPCDSAYPYITYKINKLTQFPPYSLSMPIDVIYGYIAIDSITYHSHPWLAYQYMLNQPFNDTLKKIFKHYYKMVDWDPIKYEQTRLYTSINIRSAGHLLERYISRIIKQKADNPKLDYPLLTSSYILQIKASGIIGYFDSTAPKPIDACYDIKCEVIDTIKGKVIPLKHFPETPGGIVPQGADKKMQYEPEKLPLPDSAFVFGYCPGWAYGLREPDKSPLIKLNQEYIVFIKSFIICEDSTHLYIDFSPAWPDYSSFLILKIQDGNVVDPSDSFGWGEIVPLTQWKELLRSRIQQILNY